MPRRSRLNEEQKASIAELREKGLSYGFISQRLDLSEGAISWYCLVGGIESPNTRGKIPPPVKHESYVRNGRVVVAFSTADDELLLRLEAEGKGYGEIGRIMGRPSNSVRGRLATLARHEARREAAE